MTDDLAAFLRARLDEERRAANRARSDAGEHWDARDISVDLDGASEVDGCFNTVAVSEHVSRYDPSRALFEIEVKRAALTDYLVACQAVSAAVDRHLKSGSSDHGAEVEARLHIRDQHETTVRYMAMTFAWHPEYRHEWSPALRAGWRP